MFKEGQVSIVSENGELFSEVHLDKRTLRAIRVDLDGKFKQWKVELVLKAYFQRHVLSGSPRNKRAYCYGVSEGEIILETPACDLQDSDSGLSLSVSVEESQGGSEKTASDFSPEIAFETPAGGFSAKVGSRNKEQSSAQDKRIEYTIDEDLIAVVPHRRGLNCMVTKATGGGITFDYIYSSFSLNMLFHGQRRNFYGSVVIRPGAFSVYDPSGRRLSEKLSLWGMLLAFREGRYPGHEFSQEYKVSFTSEVPV